MRKAKNSNDFARMIEEEFGKDTVLVSEASDFGNIVDDDNIVGTAGELADMIRDFAFFDWYRGFSYRGCGDVVDPEGNIVLEKLDEEGGNK